MKFSKDKKKIESEKTESDTADSFLPSVSVGGEKLVTKANLLKKIRLKICK